MNDTRIARRYASAVFKVSMQEGGDAISRRGEWFVQLNQMLDENSSLDNVFKSPIFTVAERRLLYHE